MGWRVGGWLGLALALLAGAAWSAAPGPEGALVAAYRKAQGVDPLYLAGQAEYAANRISARVAGAAYYPQLKFSTSQLENEAGGQRRTLSVMQPVISADRFATLREKAPRTEISEATLALRQQDLAKRLYLAVSDWLLARESSRQNLVRLDALSQQLKASNRAFELGQGTITDLRDAEVKLLQARAEDLKLQVDLRSAGQVYASIVGDSTPGLSLREQGKTTADLRQGFGLTWEHNPELRLARQQQRLGELAVGRANSAWIPELIVSFTMTDMNGEKSNFAGLSLSMPVQAGSILGLYSARANLEKLQAETRDKERRVGLEVERLQALVDSGWDEVSMRESAIRAAELSVAANKKSYKGGVRSLLDVLNAIEVLYSVRNDYVKALLGLGENLLNLGLQQGISVEEALQAVESVLLQRA